MKTVSWLPRSHRLFFGIIVLFAELTLVRAAETEANFLGEVRAWVERHRSDLEAAQSAAMAGDAASGNLRLIASAEKSGTPAAAFVIGNMLFKSDPVASYRLHAKAFQAQPSEPAVVLEMAMEQHRKGEYELAIANYRKFLPRGEGGQYAALLADCLLRTDRLQEAVAAWKTANHPSRHTSIDFAICEIYGPTAPMQRRGELVTKAKAGDRSTLADLILLDLHFNRDWWNAEAFEAGLEQDLKLASGVLGANDPRYHHLAVYAKLARQEGKRPEQIRSDLTQVRLVVGPGAVLPESSALARGVIEMVVRAKIATEVQILEQYKAELQARVAKHDRHALHLLCWLAQGQEATELESLTRLGWKEWHDSEFAASYVLQLGKTKKMDLMQTELSAALATLPEDHTLNTLRMSLAGESAVTREMLVAAIKAEYRQLSPGMIIPDSYRLKGLFYELEKKL